MSCMVRAVVYVVAIEKKPCIHFIILYRTSLGPFPCVLFLPETEEQEEEVQWMLLSPSGQGREPALPQCQPDPFSSPLRPNDTKTP